MQDDDDDFDADHGMDEQAFDGSTEVTCPHCGQTVEISVDTGGGEDQEYIEDCPVCCRPWRVLVQVGDDGMPHVHVEEA